MPPTKFQHVKTSLEGQNANETQKTLVIVVLWVAHGHGKPTISAKVQAPWPQLLGPGFSQRQCPCEPKPKNSRSPAPNPT